MDREALRARVAGMMPGVVDDLVRLAEIPSVGAAGYPREPVLRMAGETVALLSRYGFERVGLLEVPNAFPLVYGEVAGPPDAPTVLLYAHYDVHPAAREEGWEGDPWVPVRRGRRIVGRGVADDKSGILVHAGSVRALEGRPPVGLKVLIAGAEEPGGLLESFIRAHAGVFRSDVYVVADGGNVRVGEPTLVVSARGEAECLVEVRTLRRSVDAACYAGAAPDALLALGRLLATLHDEAGDVAVDGLSGFDWPGAEPAEAELRRAAGLLEGVRLAGTGSLASRLWSRPAITVTGVDARPAVQPGREISSRARARLRLATAPGADPRRELEQLARHLRRAAPWGVSVDVQRVRLTPSVRLPADSPVMVAAREALEWAFGHPAAEAGLAGPLPILAPLRDIAPKAGFVIWGAADRADARCHALDESVDPGEIERLVLAEAVFLEALAARVEDPAALPGSAA
ncbi:MAG TPA: M20/M25/M40 family metallo-hydrolase [Longimicrobiales bacterium]|nr:M20/M25/M40 family metallo-hydrolase [Longimicrobiales bacterium]